MSIQVNSTINRVALRYHGGKFLLAPWIISHFKEHRLYVEPFGGGGSVLLRKTRSYAEIYNDINSEVYNVFEMLRTQGEDLLRLIELTPFSRNEFQLSYQETNCPLEKARRTIVRSFMGFGSNGINAKLNTGFRSDTSRSGTTPALDWKTYPEHIKTFIERFKGVVVENRDAIDLIEKVDRVDTLFYVDPPYLHETRSKGKNANDYEFEMNIDQHEFLLKKLISLKGMVVLSGYDNELYNDHLKTWNKVEKSTYADGAKKRKEVLWINYRLNNQTKLFE